MASNAAAVRGGLSIIARGTALLLVGTFCLILLTFVSRVILVRGFSIPEWNAFSFALTLGGVLTAVGVLGLPNATARSIPYAGSDAERKSIVRGAALVGAAAATVCGVLLWFSASPIASALGEPELTLALQFFSIAVACSIGYTLISSIFQGFADVVPNALVVQVINPGIFVGFLVVEEILPPHSIAYEDSLIGYASASVVTLALLIVYAIRRLPRHLPRGGPSRDPSALHRLMLFAAPLFVVGLMSSLIGSGDTLVLGVYHSAEVGTYVASVTLARLLALGLAALGYIFLPVATKFLRHQDQHAISLTYATSTKWMILFSLPLFLVFFFLPGASLTLVYGSAYSTTVLPLRILVLGSFVTTILGPALATQVAVGQTRLLMLNAIVAASIDIVFSLALAPRFGYSGAAVAWASANVVLDALSLSQLALLSGIHPFRRNLLLPMLATAIPVGLVFATFVSSLPSWSTPIVGLGAAGFFLLAVLLTKSVDAGDRLLLESVEDRLGRPLTWVRRIGQFGVRRSR